MTFTQIDIPEIAKPGHKVGDQGYGNKQFDGLQPLPGDKSFNASWNEMQLSKMNPQSVQHVVNDLTLFTSKEPELPKSDAHGLKVAQGLPDLGNSAVFTELKETVRDADKQLDKGNEKPGHWVETYRNPDGSIVHRVDGKVTEVDYPNGGKCKFTYDDHGDVERVVWERKDHSKITLQRRHVFGPHETMVYDEIETDSKGKVTAKNMGLPNSCVNVDKNTGSFEFGCYVQNKDGSRTYWYSTFPTTGAEHGRRQGPPPAGA
jgi:hypothetical protein